MISIQLYIALCLSLAQFTFSLQVPPSSCNAVNSRYCSGGGPFLHTLPTIPSSSTGLHAHRVWKRNNPHSSMDGHDSSSLTTTRRRTFFKTRFQQRVGSLSISVLLALTTWIKSPLVAMADFPSSSPPVRMSLRPGITPDEIKRELLTKTQRESKQSSGELQYFQLDHEQDVDMKSSSSSQESTSAKPDAVSSSSSKTDTKSRSSRKKVKQIQREEYDDDYLDIEDEEDGEEEEESIKPPLPTRSSSFSKKGSRKPNLMAVQRSTTPSSSGVVQTVSSLSGAGPKLSQKAETAMVKKAVIAMFGPVIGICFLREADRWNKEQKRVDQRIDLLKIQKEEMKKQQSSSDDDDTKGDKGDKKDDDDDDDDDDDEEDEDDKKDDKKGKGKGKRKN